MSKNYLVSFIMFLNTFWTSENTRKSGCQNAKLHVEKIVWSDECFSRQLLIVGAVIKWNRKLQWTEVIKILKIKNSKKYFYLKSEQLPSKSTNLTNNIVICRLRWELSKLFVSFLGYWGWCGSPIYGGFKNKLSPK